VRQELSLVPKEESDMGISWKSKKSWREKLENPPPGLPKVVEVPQNWEKRMGGKRVLVPTPLQVDELIHKVPKGRLATVGQIRQQLAETCAAESTCPMTTGIHLRIVSEAAEEDRALGKRTVTPYWRIIKEDGSLNPKFAGGVESQSARLLEEGHTIDPAKGNKPPKVHHFEKKLVNSLA
jgi:alkylated DNA nucleotide flippase Atl1